MNIWDLNEAVGFYLVMLVIFIFILVMLVGYDN